MSRRSQTPRGEPSFFSGQVSKARRFYRDLTPPKNAELAVICAGCEHCDADYEIDRASFPYLSMEYLAAGEGDLALDGRSYRLVPGTAFSYGPGVRHHIRTDPTRAMVKFFVDFAGSKAEGHLQRASLCPGRVVQVSAPGEVTEAFDRLIAEGLQDSRLADEICTTLLQYLLLKIDNTVVPYGSGETRAFSTYQRCHHHIREHYLELHTLEETARACHVAPAYLCRLFKRFDHLSPYQYLLRLKMNRAAELLHRPGALVKQVADELDFADPYHLSRVFKRVHGVPPEQFVRLRDDRMPPPPLQEDSDPE